VNCRRHHTSAEQQRSFQKRLSLGEAPNGWMKSAAGSSSHGCVSHVVAETDSWNNCVTVSSSGWAIAS